MNRKYKKGDRAVYYGSLVTILHADKNTAYVRQGKEFFAVDYSLLSKPKSNTQKNK